MDSTPPEDSTLLEDVAEVERIAEGYLRLLLTPKQVHTDASHVADLPNSLAFNPDFTVALERYLLPSRLVQLLRHAQSGFLADSTVETLAAPIAVVGGLKSDIDALVDYLGDWLVLDQQADILTSSSSLPPVRLRTSVLFLGEFTSRRQPSLLVVAAVCALKILFPCDVFALRGSAEVAKLSFAAYTYPPDGWSHPFLSYAHFCVMTELRLLETDTAQFSDWFKGSPLEEYCSTRVWENFIDWCDSLPLAGEIVAGDDSLMCISGGLDPYFHDRHEEFMAVLRGVQRPCTASTTDYDGPHDEKRTVCNMAGGVCDVNSDEKGWWLSQRGYGYGCDGTVIGPFLKATGYSGLITAGFGVSIEGGATLHAVIDGTQEGRTALHINVRSNGFRWNAETNNTVGYLYIDADGKFRNIQRAPSAHVW